MADDPYHAGEIAVQERAGVRAMARKIGAGIHDAIAPGLASFLAGRDLAVVGARDDRGRVWASLLTGSPGFLRVRGPVTLLVDAVLPAGDPLARALVEGASVGLIAIDLATRRRARVNGTIRWTGERSFAVEVRQAYGNCPKYIQQREVAVTVKPASDLPSPSRSASLDRRQQEWIARADTFFVATAHAEAGADASHRGGAPGFVRAAEKRIVWPDYAGNTMFQTLGNLAADGACGLLFLDFESGATLQASGRARIDWDATHAASLAGAERLVEMAVEEVVESAPSGRVRGPLVEASPFNP